jgi:phosphatidylglycerol:prolipoprotein diacylglycerol transferase
MVARAGCTLAHHHPGVRTSANSPLAFAYPDGARWDLGLLELLLATGCTLVFLVLWRRPRAAGTYVALGALLYAPSRFAFDFLRASPLHGGDPRYAGLTAAQWGCFLLAAIGLLAWRSAHEERGRARRAPIA